MVKMYCSAMRPILCPGRHCQRCVIFARVSGPAQKVKRGWHAPPVTRSAVVACALEGKSPRGSAEVLPCGEGAGCKESWDRQPCLSLFKKDRQGCLSHGGSASCIHLPP